MSLENNLECASLRLRKIDADHAALLLDALRTKIRERYSALVSGILAPQRLTDRDKTVARLPTVARVAC